MKRPFVWLCIALAIVPTVRYAVSGDAGGAAWGSAVSGGTVSGDLAEDASPGGVLSGGAALGDPAEDVSPGGAASGSIAEGASPAQAAAWLAKEAAGGPLTVTGTVARCSAASAGVRLSVNHLTIQRKDNSEQTLSKHIQIAITTEQTDLLPGDRILASGEVMEWTPATNPGQFDQREYYFLQDTACMLTRADIRKLQSGGPGLDRALCRLRRMLSASYDRILGAEEAGAMAAISLGERGRLSQEWKDRFQEGGISHILAVSGLHVSMIGMGLYGLLRRFGAPYPPACAVSGLAVLFYARMSGSGISALRAALMFLVWLGAQLCGRKYDMTTAAAAAAAALILGNPGSLYQSSFLLSFAAVLAIAVLLPCLKTVFLADRRGGAARRGPGGALADAALSGAGIMIGTLPVTLYFFYQISPWSLLVNLAVLPLMSALMVCGLLAAAVGLLSVPLGTFCAAPAGYILRCFDLLCGLEKRLPCPVWVAGRPALWRIALYYGILLAAGAASYRLLRGENSVERRHAGCGRTQSRLGQKIRGCRENRVRKRHAKCERIQSRGKETVRRRRESAETRLHGRTVLRLLWIVCAAGCLCLVSPPARKDLTVYCLDVGQGDAQLLCLPGGTTCLIDGGSSSESQVWRYRIGQAVRYCGARTLDYIFLSHADQDHISGVEEYLEEYEAGFGGANVHGVTLKHLVLPPTADAEDFARLKALAGRNGIEVLQMAAGAQIGVTGGSLPWSITCLAPSEAELSGERNEDSMVLMLRYGAFRMLFTGDLEGDAELRLAASGEDLSADVLKVGHHGSRGASSQEFLRRVTPAAAVISCGAQNSYGHPSPETLARLEDAGSRIYRTPETGAVAIRSDGGRFVVKTWRGMSQ